MREVPEWIAKHDDQAIPPRVRLRVFERYGGVCQLTGRKINAGDRWDVDHRTALIFGGQHREANLQPVLATAHKVKSAAEMSVKAKADRQRLAHLGLKKPKGRGFRGHRKFNGEIVWKE